MRTFRLFLCLLIFSLALPRLASGDEDAPRVTLETVKSTLSEIDDELKLPNLSDGQLSQLRARVDPLAGQLQVVIADLTPRLEASRKRLAELKPKSKDRPPEPDPAADDLKAEQTNFDKLDADLRSARAALLQVDDFSARISAARREIFTHETFARSSSVLSPVLWLSVARELPSDISGFRRLMTEVTARTAARLSWLQIAGFLGVCVALAVLAAPLRWLAHRVLAPHTQQAAPGRLRKAVSAAWTLIVLAALPIAGLGIVSYALDAFDVSDPQLQDVASALFDGLRLTGIAYAISSAMMSPKSAAWRMVGVSDFAATRLVRFAVVVAITWGASRFVEAMATQVASYNLLVLTRALAATAIGAIAANTLRRLHRAANASASTTEVGTTDAWRPARTFGWAYVAAIFACTLTGYIALATFLVEHALQIAGAAAVLFLADSLMQESGDRLLRPDSALARSLMATLGLRREGLEQIVVLFQGLSRLAVIALALIVAVGPFGMPSQDLIATLRTAYFGFSVGGVTLSISTLVGAVVVFVLILVATRGAQGWLSERYLPRTRLDSGVKNSIGTIFGYVGVVVALLAGGSRLGVDADRLAWIAGGLSVGIGFGLQGIANNFISGLILLWERGIKVGDWVVVGPEQGFVRRINARSTEIETFERATLIVPNLTLVTGSVKNWLHSDRVARIVVPVNAAFESDPEVVRRLLIDAAKAQEAVLTIPAPLALFAEMADWAMKFQLICYVEDALLAERVRSELNFDIMQRVRAAGLRIPYPFPVANVEGERGPNTSRVV